MSVDDGRGRWAALRAAVATLDPGYFALVMATGIVSVGVGNLGLGTLSAILMWLAVACYAVLVVLSCWRWIAFRANVLADFSDPRRGFGFFTFVAGTDVLGARLLADGHHGVALGLLACGGLAWLVLGYVVPWTAVLSRTKRPVVAGANGTWFVWVVASQSVAVLAAALQPIVGFGTRELALLAFGSWSVGIFLYGAAGVFVAARLMLYPVGPSDLTPPYWVAMGATAITVLSGSQIVQMLDTPAVEVTRGLVAGLSVVFWSVGTWLIPPLVAAGWWRHITHRVPLRYDSALWSIVFPLGMYGVAGYDIGQADLLPIVQAIGQHETWVALAAWAAAFLAMIVHLVRTVVVRPGSRAGEQPSIPRRSAVS
ncbi:tellurite resistance/C4-dicarboxylate transporter family protein [Pseudonocardia asaccharolytica]|uniref:Tellurite resistance protein permease n=1 Tax=Pseudonocardia asaccharolytica DSM 44247 = NBRC 16224 TaxID=1123024 RepID=A0A511CZU4_9PSEU|nr:tellurite resistance/C4-dicarboxylate transporter family protein [Pseudonocardia asaccharolytica]GEL18070.1 tellurite resistance protein permease [Pseudonocardia asaccharolytica DSM 44247 = NBRC 16224]